MEMHRLAAKQKRIREWSKALESCVNNEGLRVSIVDTLKNYRNLLAKCWEAGAISSQEQSDVEDLERQLEGLFDELRLLG